MNLFFYVTWKLDFIICEMSWLTKSFKKFLVQLLVVLHAKKMSTIFPRCYHRWPYYKDENINDSFQRPSLYFTISWIFLWCTEKGKIYCTCVYQNVHDSTFLGAVSLYKNLQQCWGFISCPFPWFPWPSSCHCGFYHNVV